MENDPLYDYFSYADEMGIEGFVDDAARAEREKFKSRSHKDNNSTASSDDVGAVVERHVQGW
jgi:hypothetical protein